MSYTSYSEFDEEDFAGNDVLTTTVTLHEYRNLITRSAFLEGYVRGVLGAIDELSKGAENGMSMLECLDAKVRELFEEKTTTNEEEAINA